MSIIFFMLWYKGEDGPACELTHAKVSDIKYEPELKFRLDYEFKCRNREPIFPVKYTRFDVGVKFRGAVMKPVQAVLFKPFKVPAKEESYVYKSSAVVRHELSPEETGALEAEREAGGIPIELDIDAHAGHRVGKLRMDSVRGTARCYINLVIPQKNAATPAKDIVVEKLGKDVKDIVVERLGKEACSVSLYRKKHFSPEYEC